MNQVTKPAFTLPADFGDRLMAGIADTRSSLTLGAGGQELLRLLRNGTWVYGSRNEPVAPGSQWAVNLPSLSRGWVCWGDGELLGQAMASILAPRLDQPAPINGVPFAEQFSMEMTCIAGANAGDNVLYKNNSYGYKTAFDKLTSDIQAQYQADKRFYWPVIELYEEDYQHKKYGQIWNPILVVTAWADAEGNIKGSTPAQTTQGPGSGPVQPQPEAKPAPAPRARRAPPQAAAQPSQAASPPAGMHTFTNGNGPEAAPVSTQQAHTGQRRRPAR